jgi:hypothetical protein
MVETVITPHSGEDRSQNVKPDTTEVCPSAKSTNTELSLFDDQCLIGAMQCLISVFELHGFNSHQYSTKFTLHHWRLCARECGGYVPFMKYKLAAFYAAAHTIYLQDNQDIPPQPFSQIDTAHVILGGRAYKFVQYLARNDRVMFKSLITTVLNSKKGMPRPDELMLRKGEADTAKSLTTEPIAPPKVNLLSWADQSECTNNLINEKSDLTDQLLESELRRTVKEIFAGEHYTDSDRYNPFFPSTSANYINSRSKGGAVGFIMQDPKYLMDLRYDEYKMKLDVNVVDDSIPIYTVNDDSMMNFRNNYWKVLYQRLFTDALSEEPTAVPLGLAEALKVRVITKGPPLLNTVLKPLQRFLWKVLKRQSTFKLVGEWIRTEYLATQLGSKLTDGYKYLSVDYKDATNQMRGFISNVICDEISRQVGLTNDEAMLFKRALTGHIIEMPDGSKKPQLNGQLMGSIVSFPVLCIANATILRLTRELDCKRLFTLDQAGVIVNGDDGLLKATRNGKLIWEKIATFCGLKPSVGKVYFSDKFFNINSTTYNYDPDTVSETYQVRRVNRGSGLLEDVTKNIHFQLSPYVNMGLIYDMSRSGGEDVKSTTTVTSIGERAHELMRTCPETLKEVVLSTYMGRHLKTLMSLNLPWYIPEYLGGLGLPIIPGTKHEPNDLQLRIAAKSYKIGVVYPPLREATVWKTYGIVSKDTEKMPTDEVYFAHEQLSRLGYTSATFDDLIYDNTRLWSVSSFLASRVPETIFMKDFSTIYRELPKKKSTIESNYYRKKSRINARVASETRSGVKLSEVQPFSVGNFPQQEIKVDELAVIVSSDPFNEIHMDLLIERFEVTGRDESEIESMASLPSGLGRHDFSYLY